MRSDIIESTDRSWRQKVTVETVLFFVILILFTTQAIFLSENVPEGIYPDERYHIELSKQYALEGYPVENTEETYWMGEITKRPPLYHILMGGILRMNVIEIDERILLRFVNIGFAVITVALAYIISHKLLKDPLLRVVPVVMLTNTPMFVFLSGAVSYDNLLVLLAMLSLLGVVEIINGEKFRGTLVVLFGLGVGCLVKHTILPLIPPVVTLMIILTQAWRIEYLSGFFGYLRESMTRMVGFAGIVIVAILGCVYYGRNLIEFRSIIPSCNDVMTEEQCMESYVYQRDRSIKRDVLEEDRLSPGQYAFHWGRIIVRQVFGYTGHQYIWPSVLEMIPVFIFLGVAAVFSGVFVITGDRKIVYSLLLIVLFYVVVLMYYQNYRGYLNHGNIYLAVQGRYVFPILFTSYLVPILGLSVVKKRSVRIGLSLVIITCFILMNGLIFVKALKGSPSDGGTFQLVNSERGVTVESTHSYS